MVDRKISLLIPEGKLGHHNSWYIQVQNTRANIETIGNNRVLYTIFRKQLITLYNKILK